MTERAFPQGNDRVVHALSIANSQGMTLRDYFAAKAIEGYTIAAMTRPRHHHDLLAIDAYALADAMLRQREKKND
jgi:hypothetical protein